MTQEEELAARRATIVRKFNDAELMGKIWWLDQLRGFQRKALNAGHRNVVSWVEELICELAATSSLLSMYAETTDLRVANEGAGYSSDYPRLLQ
jgi:hypothetical protein